MIRDLLTPDAQRDPYAWAAVLVAHAGLGCAGWVLIGWWAVLVYLTFEAVQAVAARQALWWDSVLDACAFAIGAALMAAGWAQDTGLAVLAIVAIAIIAAAGAAARRNFSGKDFHGQG